jgi:hypothetical protein
VNEHTTFPETQEFFGIECSLKEWPDLPPDCIGRELLETRTYVQWDRACETKDGDGRTLTVKKAASIQQWYRFTFPTMDGKETYNHGDRVCYQTDREVCTVEYFGTRYDDDYGDCSTSYMMVVVSAQIFDQMCEERLKELVNDWEEENPRRYRKIAKPERKDAEHWTLSELAGVPAQGTHCQHSYDCCGNFYYSSPTFSALNHYDPSVKKFFVEISGHRNV